MWSVLVVVCAAALPAGTPLVAEEREAFEKHVERAQRLLGSEGEVGAAIWHLRRADAIWPTSHVALQLARAHERLGDEPMRIYYGRLYLRRAPDSADEKAMSVGLNEALEKVKASGLVYVEAEASVAGEVTIAERHFPTLPAAMFVPPGTHPVKATLARATGGEPHSFARQFEAEIGRLVELDLESVPPPLVRDGEQDDAGLRRAMAARPVDLDVSAESSHRPMLRAGGWGLVAAGVAALAAGTVAGVMSGSDAAALRSAREQGRSVSDAQALAHGANAKGSLANAFWIAGGVAAGAGVLLVFTLPDVEVAQ